MENTDNVLSVLEPSLIPDITPIKSEIGIVKIKTQNIRKTNTYFAIVF